MEKEALSDKQKRSSGYLLNKYMRGEATYDQVKEACDREKIEKRIESFEIALNKVINWVPNTLKKWGLLK